MKISKILLKAVITMSLIYSNVKSSFWLNVAGSIPKKDDWKNKNLILACTMRDWGWEYMTVYWLLRRRRSEHFGKNWVSINSKRASATVHIICCICDRLTLKKFITEVFVIILKEFFIDCGFWVGLMKTSRVVKLDIAIFFHR
jgi:hypothetical protein